MTLPMLFVALISDFNKQEKGHSEDMSHTKTNSFQKEGLLPKRFACCVS